MSVPTFSPATYDKLQAIMYMKSYAKGDCLFQEGELANRFYYILNGNVRVSKLAETGKLLVLHLYRDGDLLGQLDSSGHSAYGFSAEATEESRVGIIQRKDLETLICQHGDLAVEFMKWMGLTQRITETKLRDLMMYGKPGALCSLLIRLSNSYGKLEGAHIVIPNKFNNTEMADMIGSTRENVNRMLSDLKKEDIIAFQDGRLVIKDMSYLRHICHCDHCPREVCRM